MPPPARWPLPGIVALKVKGIGADLPLIKSGVPNIRLSDSLHHRLRFERSYGFEFPRLRIRRPAG
jgi:hypothetical protein